jgi:DNA-binding NtrC family response regulator
MAFGESGTGKEVIARTIHESSNRSSRPFVAINCAAIPETLLEAELFGHAKGAFTGAIDKKTGLFEEAEGGTLFLDEIGDMPLPLQAKLLRVLQDRKIKRIGENRFREIDVRIVSATHRTLKQEVMEGKFREDLFFRLNVIPIHIPPLRERPEDIIPLAEFFLRRYSALNSTQTKRFSKDTLAVLLKHTWNGNVRELENTIERAAVLSDAEEISPIDLLMEVGYATSDSRPSPTPASILSEIKEEPASHPSNQFLLDEVIRGHIIKILEFNKGAKDKTAKMLGIDRKTLYRKLNEYGY